MPGKRLTAGRARRVAHGDGGAALVVGCLARARASAARARGLDECSSELLDRGLARCAELAGVARVGARHAWPGARGRARPPCGSQPTRARGATARAPLLTDKAHLR